MTVLRTDNARRLMQHLESHTSLQGKRILDIGCAAGWFLKVARGYGLDTVGIEPDATMAGRAEQDGLTIRNGWFPQALEAGELFDLVTFNDVFEHLLSPDDALNAVAKCLPLGGYLLLNLPCAGGFFYGVASLLARLGYSGPFERLWQCGFDSPHRYYFDHDNLRTLVESYGFRLAGRTRIEALTVRGLWARINETGTVSPIMAALMWLALVASLPATRFVLPNDIMVHLYKRC